jgi:hypothetical protein
MGKELYPHQQWDAIASLWNLLYPIDTLEKREKATLAALEAGIPEFVQMLVNFRPPSLRGRSLREVMPLAERHPSRLTRYYRDWKVAPAKMRTAPPSLVFAVIGQARADGNISPEAESKLLADLLSYWAMRSALDSSAICATTPRVRLVQPPSVPGQLTTTLQ